jgi:hypothetical protein
VLAMAAPRSRMAAEARSHRNRYLAVLAEARFFPRQPGLGKFEHGPRGALMLPAPRQKQPQISPIFICDKVTLHVSREKDKENALGRCRMGRLDPERYAFEMNDTVKSEGFFRSLGLVEHATQWRRDQYVGPRRAFPRISIPFDMIGIRFSADSLSHGAALRIDDLFQPA